MADLTFDDHFKIVLADLRDHGVTVGEPDAADGNVGPLAKVCDSYGIDVDDLMLLVSRFDDLAQVDLAQMAIERQGVDLDTVFRGIMAQSILTGWRAAKHGG